jgi:hypothetical protein
MAAGVLRRARDRVGPVDPRVLSRPGPGGSAPVIEDIWTLEDYAPPDGKLCLVGYLVELNVRPGT